ncbi:MAG: lasso peptide biosynthesis B2 protein [Pseudomarimonas sp.]
MGLFARARRYPLRELAVMAGFAILLPSTDLLLRAVGFKRVMRLVMSTRIQRPATEADLATARRLAALARAVGSHSLWQTACLPQSLLVVGWLRRRGLNAHLHIGVLKPLNQTPAHAWVEVDGIRLDPDADRHQAFAPDSRSASMALPPSVGTSDSIAPASNRAGHLFARLIVLAGFVSVLAGLAPWAMRSGLYAQTALVDTPPAIEADSSTPNRAAGDLQVGGLDDLSNPSESSAGSCPGPDSFPRPEALEVLFAFEAFGVPYLAVKYATDLIWLGLLGVALFNYRSARRWGLFTAVYVGLLVLFSGSALSAVLHGRWLELFSGARAVFAWLLAGIAGRFATARALRLTSFTCIGVLLAQSVAAPFELSAEVGFYAANLFGRELPRLVGTFEFPVALSAFAVTTWAMALCWARLGRRTLLLLAVLVTLVLLCSGSATGWVAFAATMVAAAFGQFARKTRIRLLALALPAALALWFALPSLTGRSDVHDSLWGRLHPATAFSEAHLSPLDVAFGYRFGAGVQGHQTISALTGTLAPPFFRPPTDSTPVVIFWQVGVLGVVLIYALLLLALYRDIESRPVGVALLVSSLALSISELFPLSIALGLWLARAGSLHIESMHADRSRT